MGWRSGLVVVEEGLLLVSFLLFVLHIININGHRVWRGEVVSFLSLFTSLPYLVG